MRATGRAKPWPPLIQDDLRKIGIHVNIVTLDFSSLIERIAKTSQYEAGLLGLANVEIDPDAQMNVWLSSGGMHAWYPSQRSPATPWEVRIDHSNWPRPPSLRAMRAKRRSMKCRRSSVEQEPIIYLVESGLSLWPHRPRCGGAQPSAAPPQVLWNIEWLRLDSDRRNSGARILHLGALWPDGGAAPCRVRVLRRAASWLLSA